MNTKDKGDTSEAMVIARLKELGYPVLVPFGDNQKYDLVYESGDDFVRAQVKTGRLKDGAVLFNGYTMGHNNADGNYSKTYSCDDIDVFLVYCPDTPDIYKVPVEEVGTKKRLRVEEPKIDAAQINWASDYVL